MRGMSVRFLPSLCCIFKLCLTSHHKYRGTLQVILPGTSPLGGLSVSKTACRVHLPVTWALCRIDQVTVCPGLITPYISLFLLFASSLPSGMFAFHHLATQGTRSKQSFILFSARVVFTDNLVPPVPLLSQNHSPDAHHCKML